MADKPIPFRPDMIRAILEGKKNMTRRVLKPCKPRDDEGYVMWPVYAQGQKRSGRWHAPDRAAPFFVGQRLWVKEACGRKPAEFLGIKATNGAAEAIYLADGAEILNEHEFNISPWWKGETLSSRFMPKRFSRLTLIVESVKIERLQDMNRGDAMEEGCQFPNMKDGANPLDWFRDLWNDIHGEGAWEENPWVVAIGFRIIRKNIDEVAA